MDFPKILLSYGTEVLDPIGGQAFQRSLVQNSSRQRTRRRELTTPAEMTSLALQFNDCHLLIFQYFFRRQTIANTDVGWSHQAI